MAQATAATIPVPEESIDAKVGADRKAPIIDPSFVRLDVDGHMRKQWIIRLPADFRSDDLKEIEPWKKVQKGARPMQKFDIVTFVAFDESWIAEANVAFADVTKVVLSKPRITTFPTRFDRLPEDDKYRIRWVGNGWCVERKKDNQIMSNPVQSLRAAESDLRNLYPKVL